MVRAIKLQVNPSGSYYNPSQGGFTTINISLMPPRLLATRAGGNITLTWNSQSGAVYHVQAKSEPFSGNWLDVSGPINATNTMTSWADGAGAADSGRFYRVVSP